MARGNARELAREKNAKKQAQQKKGGEHASGLSYAKRKELDAERIRAKQAAKDAARAAGETSDARK